MEISYFLGVEMKGIITSILFLVATTVFAEPAPFGLEIGKATVEETKKLYRIEKNIETEDHFTTYKIPVNQVSFDGLKELTVTFNKKNLLIGILAKLPKNRLKSIHESLSKKYKVVSQKIRFAGDSYAEYAEGSTVILLNAPHLSVNLEIVYVEKNTLLFAKARKEEKDNAVKKDQEDQL